MPFLQPQLLVRKRDAKATASGMASYAEDNMVKPRQPRQLRLAAHSCCVVDGGGAADAGGLRTASTFLDRWLCAHERTEEVSGWDP